jgi:hypothetical protein
VALIRAGARVEGHDLFAALKELAVSEGNGELKELLSTCAPKEVQELLELQLHSEC